MMEDKIIAKTANLLTDAMVLAAGLGKRMRPLTDDCPKPLIAVAGKTMLDRALDGLAAGGIKRAVVNVHYLGAQIESHLAGRESPSISISPEYDGLLETGGGVTRALPMLQNDVFAVVNADMVWVDNSMPALEIMRECWDATRMDALLLLTPLAKAHDYAGKGDFDLDAEGRLLRNPAGKYVYNGLHLCHKNLFKSAPDGAFSLNMLWDKAIQAGRLYGAVYDGNWFHIGTPEALAYSEPLIAALEA